MSYALSGRHFLQLLDFTSEEIVGLVDLAQDLKEKKHADVYKRQILSFSSRQGCMVLQVVSRRSSAITLGHRTVCSCVGWCVMPMCSSRLRRAFSMQPACSAMSSW